MPDDDGGNGDGSGGGDADGDAGGDGGPPPGIDVIDMQKVGSYETVTFAADEASLAVQWLQDNGFIVNDTMTPYMQPYIDAGMLFVAAKLEAGAGIEAIEPLKMTYDGTTPMIPLQLTAVASEPHLTVTAYIHGDSAYAPIGHPLAEIDADRIADVGTRSNYPMLLARTIDEAGGDAWVQEYASSPVRYSLDDASGCCGSEFDSCGIGGDMQCQCPGDAFDQSDCAQVEGLLDAVELLDQLAGDHSVLTRITTRLSPEEMDHDPAFEPKGSASVPRLNLEGRMVNLDACDADVIDTARYDELTALQDCATTYCGAGECTVTDTGRAACLCDAGFVGRVFFDLDGTESVTCVPAAPPVDLGANTTLPDSCAGVQCGSGQCVTWEA